MPGPYSGRPEKDWPSITRKLVDRHPLTAELILDASLSAWTTLWQTTIGAGSTSVSLDSLGVPATVIGYFFEVLLARELEVRCRGDWRGSQAKEEKDLVYVPDPSLSVEVKTSGQRGYRIYGNRSYGQKSENDALVKKEKSGYYITANFLGTCLTLLRFGWIDAEDWKAQKSATGQMAGLSEAVYRCKLIPLPGEYRGHGPVELLTGVGPSLATQFHELGIRTINDLITTKADLPKKLSRILDRNADFLAGCRSPSE